MPPLRTTLGGLLISTLTMWTGPSVLAQPSPSVVPGIPSSTQIVIPQSRSFPLDTAMTRIGIESVRAYVDIREQTARTRLEITLKNPTSRDQEAVVLLPVPDGAVVSGFSYDGVAPEPTARVMPRDEARRLYDSIVARLLDPALLEFAGYNLIRSSSFPIGPGKTQRVELIYEHLLESDEGRIDYVLPRSESLAQRRPWSVSVQLASDHAISTVYSPSHAISAERTSPRSFRVELAESTQTNAGSFHLSYLLEREGLNASLFAYPDPAAGGGYFLLMAGLPTEPPAGRRTSREVTLVIDRSGSMAGTKMDQVRAAALQVIEGLGDDEAFNIIDYGTTVERFAETPVVKTAERGKAARAYLAGIRPGGGTNIHDALLSALRQPATDGMLPIILFLTDGLPTIGRTNEITIREMVAAANTHDRRVFTFGVGSDVNVPLLDRVATVTRGTSSYVVEGADVELAVAKVFKRLSGPIFSQPSIRTTDSGGGNSTRLVHDLIPNALPDLFEDDQLILLGRYRGEEPITFHVEGQYFDTTRHFQFTFDLGRANVRNAFVPRLWASRRIAQLIDQIRQEGAVSGLAPQVVGASLLDDPRHQELVEEILQLSTEFGILTEYTAFLAVEGTDLANWAEMRLSCSTALDTRAVRTRSGTAAVNQALNWGDQIGQRALNRANAYWNASLERVEITAVQQVNDRAFFRRGNRWVDSRLLRSRMLEPTRTINMSSPEHAELLRRFLLEGRQGILSLDGEILLLVDDEILLIRGGC